ncbi:MAG: class I SAM-dependent DNA methyltransferase [Candidatus Heimdallarchaeota archaeon]
MLVSDRRPLSSFNLTNDFGLGSSNCTNLVSVLLRAIENPVKARTKKRFRAWKEHLSRFCRYNFQSPKKSMLNLAKRFERSRLRCTEVIFCIHTYYSLIITLLASEAVFSNRNLGDHGYLRQLLCKNPSELCELLKNVPAGHINEYSGLFDIVTDNFYWWFTDEWSDSLANMIFEILKSLDSYRSIHADSNSYEALDLFKELYESLIPKGIRHDLGEYYTPNWLAEYVSDQIEIGEKTRVLDPCCGSGTFIIHVINKLKRQFRASILEEELFELIRDQVVGIDINPIAVTTARANYLIAVSDIMPCGEDNKILPIFLSDAVNPRIKGWTGSFDYVLGNPPWVGWEFLSKSYRTETFNLWKRYSLFSIKKGSEARLGGGKKDLSMLFLYRCIDLYLRKNGKLIFLINQNVFQSMKAGEGFREFSFGSDQFFSIDLVDDMVGLKPFKAVTRTAIVYCTKGKKTIYPVNYRIWSKNNKIELADNAQTLEHVRASISNTKLLAEPSGEKPESSWIIYPFSDEEVPVLIKKLRGRSKYLGKAGICTWLNGVFWVRIIERSEDGNMLIENLGNIGRKKVKIVHAKIEPDLLFPLVRGRDIGLWNIRSTDNYHVIVTNNPLTRRGIDVATMRKKYPATYSYLKTFKHELCGRPGVQKYFKSNDPFYSIYNVNKDLFSPYKLFWPEMGEFRCSIVVPTRDTYLGVKPLVPNNKVMYTSFSSKEELLFIAGLVNSPRVRRFVSAKKLGTSTTTKLLRNLKLPEYDPSLELHRLLVKEVSKVRRKGSTNQKMEILQKLSRSILCD